MGSNETNGRVFERKGRKEGEAESGGADAEVGFEGTGLRTEKHNGEEPWKGARRGVER